MGGLAELVRLAAMQHALYAGAGGAWVDGPRATVELRYQRPTLPSAWELLPNTLGVGLWLDEDDAVVPLSIGWRVALGAFEGPFVVVDAAWEARAGALGAELGGGWEVRLSNRWSVVGEARGVWLDGAGFGARAAGAVKMYLGDFGFLDD